MTGFLKRVYKTYKLCQLEDVNLNTDVNFVHLQGEHPAFRHLRRYRATCKSKFSHVRLEHTRLLPGQRPITLLKMKVVDSRGEFQQRYFYASPHSFPVWPRHTTTFTRGTSSHSAALQTLGSTWAVRDILCRGIPEGTALELRLNTLPTGRAVSESALPPGGVRTIPGHHQRRGQSRWGRAQQIQGTPSPGSDPPVEEVP